MSSLYAALSNLVAQCVGDGCVRTGNKGNKQNVLRHSSPKLLSVRPPVLGPAKLPIVGETSRVAVAGRQVASWLCGSGKTAALHQRPDRSAMQMGSFQTHAWDSTVV